MMHIFKNSLILFFFLVFSLSRAQDVKVFYEQTETGYVIFASNNEVCNVSIELKIRMQNMASTAEREEVHVIQGLTKKVELTKVSIIDPDKEFGMKYEYWTNFGDHNLSSFDSTYIYNLPYSKSEKYFITQSSNGSFSHQGIHAVDFSMPQNTRVLAIRSGLVVKVVDSNKKGCGQEKCLKYNNYITIQHSDGTFAQYVHLKKKGARVTVGQKVEKGQVIALSGNTGWSTDPHLHLEIYLQRLRGKETIKSQFLVEDGETSKFLQKGKTYLRNY